MSVRIDVVNFALGLLGEGEITSIEDSSDKARTMKTFYYIARDAVLEDAEWTFATKRFLPAVTTAPEWGYTFAYTIPSDIIRVTQVDQNWSASTGLATDTTQPNPVPHVIEGNEILCNVSPIYCKGIRRMEDEGGYSPLFVEAFAAKLAYLAALPITASLQKQQAMLALHTGLIRSAKSKDGMQNSTRRLRHRTLGKARY